jgi:hypothetical protein
MTRIRVVTTMTTIVRNRVTDDATDMTPAMAS